MVGPRAYVNLCVGMIHPTSGGGFKRESAVTVGHYQPQVRFQCAIDTSERCMRRSKNFGNLSHDVLAKRQIWNQISVFLPLES